MNHLVLSLDQPSNFQNGGWATNYVGPLAPQFLARIWPGVKDHLKWWKVMFIEDETFSGFFGTKQPLFGADWQQWKLCSSLFGTRWLDHEWCLDLYLGSSCQSCTGFGSHTSMLLALLFQWQLVGGMPGVEDWLGVQYLSFQFSLRSHHLQLLALFQLRVWPVWDPGETRHQAQPD